MTRKVKSVELEAKIIKARETKEALMQAYAQFDSWGLKGAKQDFEMFAYAYNVDRVRVICEYLPKFVEQENFDTGDTRLRWTRTTKVCKDTKQLVKHEIIHMWQNGGGIVLKSRIDFDFLEGFVTLTKIYKAYDADVKVEKIKYALDTEICCTFS